MNVKILNTRRRISVGFFWNPGPSTSLSLSPEIIVGSGFFRNIFERLFFNLAHQK